MSWEVKTATVFVMTSSSSAHFVSSVCLHSLSPLFVFSHHALVSSHQINPKNQLRNVSKLRIYKYTYKQDYAAHVGIPPNSIEDTGNDVQLLVCAQNLPLFTSLFF